MANRKNLACRSLVQTGYEVMRMVEPGTISGGASSYVLLLMISQVTGFYQFRIIRCLVEISYIAMI